MEEEGERREEEGHGLVVLTVSKRRSRARWIEPLRCSTHMFTESRPDQLAGCNPNSLMTLPVLGWRPGRMRRITGGLGSAEPGWGQ